MGRDNFLNTLDNIMFLMLCQFHPKLYLFLYLEEVSVADISPTKPEKSDSGSANEQVDKTVC